MLGTRSNGEANMFFTRMLANGTHTVTAEIRFVDGQVVLERATFVTANPGPPLRLILP